MYKKDAPTLKPITAISEPTHFPRMKPANKQTGDPNPKNGKTHNIVKIKKNRDNKNMFFVFISEKYSIFFFINS